ncbi:MAG: hypothetical protein V3V14_03645, partial [Saprospiraceae bacterium]
MPLIPMHPSLTAAMHHYDSHMGHTNINVKDLQDVEDLLMNIILSQLEFKKKTVIITGPNQDSAWLAKVLSKLELSKYCLVWTPEYIHQQKPLQRIKAFSSKKNLTFDADRHRVLRNVVDDLKSIITDQLSVLSHSALGRLSWYDLLKKWSQVEANNDDTSLVSIDGNWKDFNYSEYLYTIAEAESDYKEVYVLLHKISSFHPNVYGSSPDLSALQDELADFNEELTELQGLFNNRYSTLRLKITKSIYNDYRQLVKINQRLEKHMSRIVARSATITEENKLFSEMCSVLEYHTIENHLEELEKWQLQGDNPKLEWLNKNRNKWTVADLNNLVSHLNDEVVKYRNGLNKKIEEKLSRLGPYNIDDKGIKLLEEKLNDFINGLNASELFIIKYTNNALDLGNKLSLIDEILKEIHRGIVLLDSYPDYFEWRASLQQDQVDSILNEFSYTSEVWKSAVGKSILHKCLENHFDPQILNLKNDVETLVVKEKELCKSTLQLIHYQAYVSRTESLNVLKQEDSYGYQQLLNGSGNGDNIFNVFTQHPDLFQAFFPIVLTTQKDYNELRAHNSHDIWDNNIALNCSRIEEENKSTLVVNIGSNESEDAQVFLNEYVNFNKINHLKSIAVTERYEDAVKVADLIMSHTTEVSIFQMRNTSIISCLTNEIEDLISMQFIPQGIKCLHKKTTTSEGVTEALLDGESEIFMFIENGFIGQISPQHIVWHQNMI